MEATRAESGILSEVTIGKDHEGKTSMVGIMSRPSYPLARTLEVPGWSIFEIGSLLGKEHELSAVANQVTIRKQFTHTYVTLCTGML